MSNAPLEYIELRQRRDFSAVISTGFQFIRQNWKTLYRPLVFLCLPLYIVASLFMGSFFRTIYANPGDPAAVLGSMGGMSAGYLLMALSMLLMYTLVFEYMRFYMLNRGLAPTLGELWKEASRQLIPYFVIGLLAGIIAMFGLLLLFFGALWLAIVFTMAMPLRAFERASIGDCIGRSFKLVKGHWWETFGLVLVLAMLIGFVSYFIYLPFLLLTGFGAMSGLEDPMQAGEQLGWMMTVFMLVAGVVNVLLQPFLQVPIGLQALSLLEEKEGRGLLQRVDEATAPPAA
ncbi:MAG: glycerophosphoryl diester phosphodiesterase membrane domain-containing protein [Flavobacteriales bacterium]|nr:glycerophosphoryl diester phosphodiesterase membrane domain-containing protein [Flavobacteriales bacterium]MBP9080562.1 glycerophosphoryl diester phosphodiesterase membrane domain-containing protein [Flavobacteriales bacterium]